MNRRLADPRLQTLLAAGIFIGLALWTADDLKAWLGPLVQRALPVHTSALGECHAPVEGEQLLIVVTKRGGKVRVDSCMFVGSRGTYSRKGAGT